VKSQAAAFDGWLTGAQAARLLGGVSPKTVSRWAAAGKLPYAKTLGGHRRYRKAEVLELAAELYSETTDE
jgi:excisionase family DNA binding protein